jgi:hypothetical protein
MNSYKKKEEGIEGIEEKELEELCEALEGGTEVEIPPKYLKDDYLKKTLSYGRRLIHSLAIKGCIKLVPNELISEEILLLKDATGKSTTSATILGGCFQDLPKEKISKKVLCDGSMLPPIHLLASNKLLHLLPKEFLTKEMLLERDMQGMTVVHHAALKGDFSQIPDNLKTNDLLLVKDHKHKTPINYLAESGQMEYFPTKLLNEAFLIDLENPKGVNPQTHLLESIIIGAKKSNNYDLYKKSLKVVGTNSLKYIIKQSSHGERSRKNLVHDYACQEYTKRCVQNRLDEIIL